MTNIRANDYVRNGWGDRGKGYDGLFAPFSVDDYFASWGHSDREGGRRGIEERGPFDDD